MRTWWHFVTTSFAVVVLLLSTYCCHGFNTQNVGIIAQRSEECGQSRIRCLPAIQIKPINEARNWNRWNTNWNFLPGLRKQEHQQQHPTGLLHGNDEGIARGARWRHWVAIVHETFLAIWKRRLARLAALWLVGIVGQCSLGVCPAVATTTSSVGLLTRTTGVSLGVQTSASTMSSMAAVGSTTASSTFRSFNLSVTLLVFLVTAITGGVVGKNLLPSPAKQAVGGNVRQLSRVVEDDNGKVLQLTRRPKVVVEENRDTVLNLELLRQKEREDELLYRQREADLIQRKKEVELLRREKEEMRRDRKSVV